MKSPAHSALVVGRAELSQYNSSGKTNTCKQPNCLEFPDSQIAVWAAQSSKQPPITWTKNMITYHPHWQKSRRTIYRSSQNVLCFIIRAYLYGSLARYAVGCCCCCCFFVRHVSCHYLFDGNLSEAITLVVNAYTSIEWPIPVNTHKHARARAHASYALIFFHFLWFPEFAFIGLIVLSLSFSLSLSPFLCSAAILPQRTRTIRHLSAKCTSYAYAIMAIGSR